MGLTFPTAWVDDKPMSDDVWVHMLVDNELTRPQRERFIHHLQANNDWQRVATAFIDEQVMLSTLRQETNESAPQTSAENKPPRRRWWWSMATLAVGLLLGTLLGYVTRPGATSAARIVDSTGTPKPVLGNKQAAGMTEHDGSDETLPRLFMVRNTPQEAVYYADHSVPQFMLDALVLAGHRITFDQEFLGYTESLDDPRAVPINVIRIQKYENLVASTDAY